VWSIYQRVGDLCVGIVGISKLPGGGLYLTFAGFCVSVR
jgi:hypothetical protein